MKKIICLFVFAFVLVATACAARPKVGVVLGGGGAKGAAEVGVLKVMERAGIPVDYIVGTSIGSIVGGLYAAGYDAAQLDTMFRTQEWLSLLTDRRQDIGGEPYQVKDGVTYIFGFPVIDRNNSEGGFGVMRGERIAQMLDSMLCQHQCRTFAELTIPFRCVAAEFRSAQEVVLKDGEVAKAMRASMAIPGVFKPVKLNGQTLVDGGMMNNLPVDVARAMGADIVIAVDLQQNEQTPRKATEIPDMLTSLSEFLGFGRLLEWAATRPDIRKYKENVSAADIYIHPPLPDMDASSFGNKNVSRMMQVGEEEALKHWDELMELRKNILLLDLVPSGTLGGVNAHQ